MKNHINLYVVKNTKICDKAITSKPNVTDVNHTKTHDLDCTNLYELATISKILTISP